MINLKLVMLIAPRKSGFTIVELLVVIVVIAILASITLVAYTSIRGRAHDAAVKSDLSQISKKFMVYSLDNGAIPMGSSQLASLNLELSKDSYSRGYYNGSSWYNVVSCWPNGGDQTKFAIIAESKSGNVFEAKNGMIKQVDYELVGSTTVCASAGAPIVSSSTRDWFYGGDNWLSYIK